MLESTSQSTSISSQVVTQNPVGSQIPAIFSQANLFWVSGPLTQRDLTIPAGANTLGLSKSAKSIFNILIA